MKPARDDVDMLVPGARSVEPEARRMLAADPSLLALVREAVDQMARAFDEDTIDVEYVVDPDSDELDERVYVVAYTMRQDRRERLSHVRRTWWVEHPAFPSARMALTAHGL
jgi:hypothetical protein